MKEIDTDALWDKLIELTQTLDHWQDRIEMYNDTDYLTRDKILQQIVYFKKLTREVKDEL